MANNYRGNLVNLRKKKDRMIEKRILLRREIRDEIRLSDKVNIESKINRLTSEIDRTDLEILKVQKSMQNSQKWMDGDFNSLNIL